TALLQTPTLLLESRPPRSMRWLGHVFDALCSSGDITKILSGDVEADFDINIIIFGLQYGANSAITFLRMHPKVLDLMSIIHLEKLLIKEGRGPKFGEASGKIENNFLPPDCIEIVKE